MPLKHETGKATDSSASEAERRLVGAAWAQFERITAGTRHSPAHASQSVNFPGYRLLGEIHREGQGVVYQALHESTRQKVAIKVPRQGPFADSMELARFDREVDVLNRLSHPHIVAVRDRGVTAGHAYFVMDYVAGRPLDAHVAGAELSVEEILSLFGKVCDAVNEAHLRGVIHRDLKPANIRIDEEGEPRILDFGLAKMSQDAAEASSALAMTLTGQFVGSLPWASPEQVGAGSAGAERGQSARSDQGGHRPSVGATLDIRTDVYSLGVILYQLITGRFPYPVTGRIDDVVRHIVQTHPACPSSAQHRIDHDIELIVTKALSKEPERRYQSAGELARDIRHYLAHEPVTATSPSAYYRLRKFIRRHRGTVIAGVMVAAALLIAAGVSIAFGLSEARQRAAAERALARAQRAEGDARARAGELEQLAKFQQAQLSGIDAQTMGVRFRADLLRKARAAWQGPLAHDRSNAAQELNTRAEDLEKLIAGSDFTGMALDALDVNFFKPALEAIDKQFADQPLVKSRMLQTVASTLHEVGLLDAASGPQAEALAIRRRVLGDDDPATLTSISEMGQLLKSQGKLVESVALGAEALERRRRVLGDEHPVTLESIDHLGAVLHDQGKLAEAEKYFREALEKRRRLLGDDDPQTLTTMNNLGALLRDQGRLSEAEGYWREALEKRRRVLGNENPKTLSSISNMGLLLQTQGKLAEAEAYFREALEQSRRVLGEVHPNTLSFISRVGSLLLAQGKLVEAEAYCREALEKRRRGLGEEHMGTLTSIINVAAVLQAQGNLSGAQTYLAEALEKSRWVLGNDHPNTLTSINNMGNLLLAQGKFDEAEPYVREALEKSRHILGDDNPDTLTSIMNMGGLYFMQNRLAEAEPYFREALERTRRVLGEEHAETIKSIGNMGRLFQAQGKPTEAIGHLAPAAAAARKVFTGGNAVRLGRWLTALGRARIATGEFASAEANLNEAFTIFNDAKNATNPDRVTVLSGLAELYDAWNAAEPDKGHSATAAKWHAKLDESSAATQPSGHESGAVPR